MMAKVLTEVILRLAMMIPSGVAWIWKKASAYLARRKQHKELQEKAQKVEDAKTHDDVRAAADELP
jgi:hypothetical protein